MMKLKKWCESLRDDAVKSLCNDAKLRGGFGVSLYEISIYVIINDRYINSVEETDGKN